LNPDSLILDRSISPPGLRGALAPTVPSKGFAGWLEKLVWAIGCHARDGDESEGDFAGQTIR